MRLDKFLGHATRLSRTDARRAIKAGRVTLNDELARRSDHAVQPTDRVLLDGEPVAPPGFRYFMLHKPEGYICATFDNDHPTAVDLLGDEGHGLSIAGRLDKDTTGLVLLSDDGAWVHAVISPRRVCAKTYRAMLDAEPDATLVEKFAQGLMLRAEQHPTRPAELTLLGDRQAQVTLTEGRYHQVKRMFAACGLHVEALHRARIGDIVLDPELAPGEFRALRPDEINGIIA